MISIKSLASRGWLTIFCSVALCILSLVLMGNHLPMGRGLLTVAITVLPVGIYEVILGRKKFNNISLKEYRSDYEEKNRHKYIMLGLFGSALAGLTNRFTSDLEAA